MNKRIIELENEIKVLKVSERKAKETSDALFRANKEIERLTIENDKLNKFRIGVKCLFGLDN
jgi:hypothetical protein